MSFYFNSGSLLTEFREVSGGVDEITTVCTIPAPTSVDIEIIQEYDSIQNTELIELDDGENTYSTSAFDNVESNYQVNVSLGTDDWQETPEVDSIELTATEAPDTVSGTIQHDGVALEDVPVYATQGQIIRSDTTDANGNFEIGVDAETTHVFALIEINGRVRRVRTKPGITFDSATTL